MRHILVFGMTMNPSVDVGAFGDDVPALLADCIEGLACEFARNAPSLESFGNKSVGEAQGVALAFVGDVGNGCAQVKFVAVFRGVVAEDVGGVHSSHKIGYCIFAPQI